MFLSFSRVLEHTQRNFWPFFNSPGNLLHDRHKNFENSKMSISKLRVPTLTSIISAISKSNFKILVPIANFQVCWKKVRSSFVLAPEPEKIGKTKWILAYWTPCILKDCTKIRLDYEVLMFLHLTLHSFLNRRTKRWMII